MNVAGLNNLASLQKPQTTSAGKGGKSSSKDGAEKASSSFDSILGQTQSSQSAGNGKFKVEDQNGRTREEDTKKRESDVDAEAVPGQSIPAGPNTSPALGDRVSAPPTQVNGIPVPGQKNASANAANAPEDVQVDSLTRRVVWNDFLRKMKDDLGVSAEDVLKAFSSLSAEDLAKPPMQNVDKIVAALGLNDQQAMMARQFFNELIQKTQSRSLGEELQTSSKQIGLTLMTQREAERKAQSAGLARMNDNFFLKGQFARPLNMGKDASTRPFDMETSRQPNSMRLDGGAPGQSPNAQPTQDMDPRFLALTPTTNEETLAAGDDDLGKDGAKLGGAEAQVPRAMSQATPGQAKAINEMTAKMQAADTQAPDQKSVDQLLQKFMNGQSQSTTSAAAAAKAKAAAMSAMGAGPAIAAASQAAPTSQAMTAAASAPTMSAHSLNEMLASLTDGNAGQDDKGGDSTDASYLNAPLVNADSKLNNPINTAQDFQQQLQQVKPGQPMTVPDLVQQAQVMVRDGGGEMKVTMHPDGLGEVAMKVNVENGKVNVQMITESDEAKKLIERQLGDLKSSLTQNHLQVADIKVDTAGNLGKQLEQQYHDAQRQQAQAQWEQFRQDNQGWRRSFFDIGSAREFKGQGDATRDVSAPVSTNSYGARTKSNASRRLDLVA